MNVTNINQTIMNGNWTNDQLNSIIAAVKYARSRLINHNVHSTYVGDVVKFVSSRTGQYEVGTVLKVNRKNLIIQVGRDKWRVPGNMVEAA